MSAQLPVSRIAALRQALTGQADARFVWLCNFEVERDWAQGHAGIPGQSLAPGNPVVQRLQEHGFLLAEPGDVVITSHPADEDFLRYLDRAGLPIAAQLVIPDPNRLGPAPSILQSELALTALQALAGDKVYLAPMGVSAGIEAVAAATGLPVAGPPASTCLRVNSKTYSRDLASRLGLREIPGMNCATVSDLERAILGGACGPYPLIVKDAYGVSGKGLLVVRDAASARSLHAMVTRRAAKTGSDVLHMLVERFLDKQCDLTYQVTIGRNGSVSFDFVKRAMIHNGVPKGHVIPAELNPRQYGDIMEAGMKLGAALHADGYFGVAGMDALIDTQGVVLPVVEINARLNLSTYQERALQRFLQPGGLAVGRQIKVPTSDAPLPFSRLLDALGSAGCLPHDGDGLLVTGFGTVNAPSAAGGYEGRLYTLFFSKDRARLDSLQAQAECALTKLQVPVAALL
ncbi:MAG: hypothetical protein B7X31_10695 [Thiomonas sp. 13-66-29]|jgi:hypothetical protein|nr:MAG: hypothetical protein B7X31_10695 [Thiomonas sp. 13-66-29]